MDKVMLIYYNHDLCKSIIYSDYTVDVVCYHFIMLVVIIMTGLPRSMPNADQCR